MGCGPPGVYGGLLVRSPRVEFLVLQFLALAKMRGTHEIGLYFAALHLLRPLSLPGVASSLPRVTCGWGLSL